MSRMILILLVAGVAVAVAALMVSVFASGKTESSTTVARSNGVQKVAYGVMIALMFAAAAGALGDG
ncbi:MAG: hypothetical protein MK098_06915 [Marinovum sp.]|nr:hypothetical protein [Marinovum sp.]